MKSIFSLIGMFILLLSFGSKAQTGIAVPQMSNCDALVEDFMETYDIPGATFALAKDGKLVYHRAFGHADISGQETTQPYHIFRIASVSKPITSIAIMNMMEAGQLALTDKVFGTGGILENHDILANANITDPEVYDITVKNLLEHSAGWNRDVGCFPNPTTPYPWHFGGCDPIVAPLHVTQTNGTANPATEEDMITFLLEKGLDFSPGTGYAYSNIGYLVLGEIIEEISNLSYETYVQSEILAPLGICDMHIGKNRLADKMEREGEYIGNGYTTLSCYDTGELVPWEYGGFSLEAMDAHGGWIASGRDLIQLLVAIDRFDTKPDILQASTISTMTTPSANNPGYANGWAVNSADNWWHSGALDGTASFVARTNHGYTWAILLNKRDIDNPNQFWPDFDGLPWGCIASTASFPTHDLSDIPLANSSGLNFTAVTDESVTLSWVNGDGNNRIVVAKAGTSIENYPLDGIAYEDHPSFAVGDDLGNETYVVYDGSSENSVTINGLTPNTMYTFSVYDYNQSPNTGGYKLYKLCGNEPATVTTSMVSSTEEVAASNNMVNVYPSISSDWINISLTQSYNANYRIYNAAGQLIDNGNWSGRDHRIDLSSTFAAGMYWIQINLADHGTHWKKFVVE